MHRPDSRPGLGSITCPTLVAVGADDVLTPPDRAAEIGAAIPGARVSVVPACGHLSTLEQPAAVTDTLVDFLAQR
jgi:pimeloyl-ACP methyl ester carboxylesterase